MNPANSKQPTPFKTDNEALALALQTGGVPMLDCWNLYSEAMLRKLGFPTVRAAWQSGAKGTVIFIFERTSELLEILKGWEEGETDHKAGSSVHVAACTPHEFGRLAATLHLKRRDFGGLWRNRSPKFVERSEGAPVRTEEGNGYRVDFPGMKICSIDAPEAVKRKLGFIK